MQQSPPKIEVGDRVEHQGREGTVEDVFPSGICMVWFVNVRGGVSAPMNELTLLAKREAQQ